MTFTSFRTASGARRRLPAGLDVARVAGLDDEGRIVVDDFDARNAAPRTIAGYETQPFMFGLTLCCNASDKGVEDGVVCRACYGYAEVGQYLFREPDGSFPGLDPLTEIRVPIGTYGDSLEEFAADHDITVHFRRKSVSLRGEATALIAVHRAAAITKES